MRFQFALRGFAAMVALALPGATFAAGAVAPGAVNRRAGPGTEYAVIVTLPAGAQTEILGCVEDRAWCDAAWGRYRGWVASAYLAVSCAGAPAPIVRVPVAVAPPVVVYRPDAYYAAHYAGRPWYRYGAPRRVVVGPNRTCYRGPFVAGCR
jgi:uncharacterized protein YraI